MNNYAKYLKQLIVQYRSNLDQFQCESEHCVDVDQLLNIKDRQDAQHVVDIINKKNAVIKKLINAMRVAFDFFDQLINQLSAQQSYTSYSSKKEGSWWSWLNPFAKL